MVDMLRLEASCRLHEEARAKPYDDATGLPPVIQGKLTGGIGRNLTDKGFRPDEIDLMFRNDVAEATAMLSRYPWAKSLNGARENAFTEIMFALGATTFARFKDMIAAAAASNWPRAAAELSNSNLPNPGQWGPARVKTLSDMILFGAWQ